MIKKEISGEVHFKLQVRGCCFFALENAEKTSESPSKTIEWGLRLSAFEYARKAACVLRKSGCMEALGAL